MWEFSDTQKQCWGFFKGKGRLQVEEEICKNQFHSVCSFLYPSHYVWTMIYDVYYNGKYKWFFQIIFFSCDQGVHLLCQDTNAKTASRNGLLHFSLPALVNRSLKQTFYEHCKHLRIQMGNRAGLNSRTISKGLQVANRKKSQIYSHLSNIKNRNLFPHIPRLFGESTSSLKQTLHVFIPLLPSEWQVTGIVFKAHDIRIGMGSSVAQLRLFNAQARAKGSRPRILFDSKFM